LTPENKAFKASSDRLAKRVVFLNGALVILTVLLIWLTILLVRKS